MRHRGGHEEIKVRVCACVFHYGLFGERDSGADLDSSAVLIAGHAVDLVHDEDVFAAHRLRRTYRET